MNKTYLVINTGSSSVKFALFETARDLPVIVRGNLSNIGDKSLFKFQRDNLEELSVQIKDHREAIYYLIEWLQKNKYLESLAAIGHRIVYGGNRFCSSVILEENNIKILKELIPQAPLHQACSLEAVELFRHYLPSVPQIGCFDTAFHAYQDTLYKTYALPEKLRHSGIKRYGFHGLSYEWLVEELSRQKKGLAYKRIVAAHLGNGASVCGIKDGKSVDTSMGFTVLDGLPMGTRCGSMDPGAVLYMIEQLGISPAGVKSLLYNESGLKGLSGLTGDMQELLSLDGANAKLAVEYFCLKTSQYIAMMTTSIGGIDALIFTGGIGEKAISIREHITGMLKFLNIPEILVIPSNEEKMIAMHMAAFF